MPESVAIKPERRVQPIFRILKVLQMLVLAGLIVAAHGLFLHLPNRVERGRSVSALTVRPVALRGDFHPFRLAGAWNLTSSDPRFGGFSGLAIDRGQLLAINDIGSVAWFAKPDLERSTVMMTELPGGPGNGHFKAGRDSEAIASDPFGRGWWVSFERANQLWLYDRDFSRALRRIRFGWGRWPVNQGIEGLVSDRSGHLLFAEGEERIYRVKGAQPVPFAVTGKQGPFSEAARLPDGRLIGLERSLTWSGFRNALIFVHEAQDRYTIVSRTSLPLGPFDNMEGLAAERLASGATRLWMIADDNFERPQRTLLLALDLPPGGGGR